MVNTPLIHIMGMRGTDAVILVSVTAPSMIGMAVSVTRLIVQTVALSIIT